MNKQLSDLIGEIYEASLEPSRWERVLEVLCLMLNAKSAALFAHDKAQGRRIGVYAYGASRTTKLAYNLGLGNLDYAFNKMQDVEVGDARQIISASQVEIEAPLYYHALLKPNGVEHVAALSIEDTIDCYYAIGIHRAVRTDPFDHNELEILNFLYPHFKRSIRIQREFYQLKAKTLKLEASLSKVLLGILLVNSEGEITFKNQIASKILKTHPAIEERNTKLTATDFEQHKVLQEALRKSSRADPTDANPINTAIVLNNNHSEHGVALMIGPAYRFDLDDQSIVIDDCDSIVLISDPGLGHNISKEALIDAFGLGSREAEIGILLTNGMSIKKIAQQINNSEKTVQTQVKNLMRKIGVKRQQDLVRVLITSAFNSQT